MMKQVSRKITSVTVAMAYLAASIVGLSHGSLSARAEVPSNIPPPPGGIINTGGWARDPGTNGIPFDPGGVLGGDGSAGFDLPGGASAGNVINPGLGNGGPGGPFLGFLNGGAGSNGGSILQNAAFLSFLLTMFQQGSNTQKSASSAMQNLQNVSKNGVAGVPASEAKPTPGNGTTNPPGNGSSTNPPSGNGPSNPNSPGKPTGQWQDPSKPSTPGGSGNGNGNSGSKPGGSGSTPSKPGGSGAKPPPANDKPSQPPADNKPQDPPAAQPPSNPPAPPSGSGSTGQPSGTFFERGFVNSRF